MNGATDSPQNQLPIRLAVFEIRGEEKAHLATITLSGDQTITGTADADMARVRASVERYVADQESRMVSPGQVAAALAEALKQDGFVVEELPAGDFAINFQIDMTRGRVFGTNEAMHSLVPKDESLGRRIAQSLVTAMRSAFDEVAAEINTRATNGSM
jgi:hypothetical protein